MDIYKQAMYSSFFDELAKIQKVALDIGMEDTIAPGAAATQGAQQTRSLRAPTGAPTNKPGVMSNISGLWNRRMAPTTFADRVVAGARDVTSKGGLRRGVDAIKNVAGHSGWKAALTGTNLGALGTAGVVGGLGLGALGLGAHALRNRGQGGNA